MRGERTVYESGNSKQQRTQWNGPARVGSLASILLLFPLSTNTVPQLPAERRLAPATAQLTEDFTSITSLRELRDGRVLLTDPRGDRFVVADFRSDRLDTIGRVGRGPGEFAFPAPIFALAGDSTVMPVPTTRRWLLLVGARIVATLPPDAPVVRNGRFIDGADGFGRVLERVAPRPKHGVSEIGAKDSSLLVLADRRTGREDTVGRVRRAGSIVDASLDASGRITRIQGKSFSPLEVDEPSRLFIDGWIAVVRRDPYRVDWRSPDGTWRQGNTIPYQRVRVDRREREAAMRFAAEQSGSKPYDPDTFDRWPEELPPFSEFRTYPVVPTPEGHIAIRRTRSARAPEPRYDVVDRRGRVVTRLVLDRGEAIVGFGVGAVYVVRTDEDGLNFLARHPWPVAGRERIP